MCDIIKKDFGFGEKTMSSEKTQKVKKKKERKVRPRDKFIWLAVSAVIAVAGYFLRTYDVEMNTVFKLVFAVSLLLTIIMASQCMSVERFRYAPNEETGDKGDKKKYFLMSVIYYAFILVAVFYVFFSLWVCSVVSV